MVNIKHPLTTFANRKIIAQNQNKYRSGFYCYCCACINDGYFVDDPCTIIGQANRKAAQLLAPFIEANNFAQRFAIGGRRLIPGVSKR